MLKKIKDLFRSAFARSTGVLLGGTAAAQIISVAALPILTRLYSPADFKYLATYTSLLGILSVAACLRLDIAIPLPERDEDAANLLVLALFSSFVFSISLLIGVALFSAEIAHLISQPFLQPYLWLLPVGLWAASSYSALQFWATRKKRFKIIAQTRFTQATGGAVVQIGLGSISLAPLGLILGQAINSGMGIFGMVRDIWKQDRKILHAITWPSASAALKEYRRFPKYSVAEALANVGGIQLPIIIIAALHFGGEAGFLMLAMRTMQAPLGLIGGAIGQVYLAHAAAKHREGELGAFTSQAVERLVKFGAGPIIFASILGKELFPLIFGSDWARSGELLIWMAPWFIFQFVASPISMIMYVRQFQKSMLVLTFFGLCLRTLATAFAAEHYPHYISEFFAISSGAFYLMCFFVFAAAGGLKAKDFSAALLRVFPITGLWIFCAFFAKYIIGMVVQ